MPKRPSIPARAIYKKGQRCQWLSMIRNQSHALAAQPLLALDAMTLPAVCRAPISTSISGVAFGSRPSTWLSVAGACRGPVGWGCRAGGPPPAVKSAAGPLADVAPDDTSLLDTVVMLAASPCWAARGERLLKGPDREGAAGGFMQPACLHLKEGTCKTSSLKDMSGRRLMT